LAATTAALALPATLEPRLGVLTSTNALPTMAVVPFLPPFLAPTPTVLVFAACVRWVTLVTAPCVLTSTNAPLTMVVAPFLPIVLTPLVLALARVVPLGTAVTALSAPISMNAPFPTVDAPASFSVTIPMVHVLAMTVPSVTVRWVNLVMISTNVPPQTVDARRCKSVVTFLVVASARPSLLTTPSQPQLPLSLTATVLFSSLRPLVDNNFSCLSTCHKTLTSLQCLFGTVLVLPSATSSALPSSSRSTLLDS
jgi:hypothetical protein